MKTEQNIGNWTAVINIDGKAPQITVFGNFPAKGQKPAYHLIKNEPQGVNDKELLLTLVFGELVDPSGTIYFTSSYTEILATIEQYSTVLVVDGNSRTLANIDVKTLTVEGKNDIDYNYFSPYLETLKAIEIDGNDLKIRVPSNGLTNNESFEIEINEGFTQQPPFLLSIRRIKVDFGKAYLPHGVELIYNLSDYTSNPNASLNLENLISS